MAEPPLEPGDGAADLVTRSCSRSAVELTASLLDVLAEGGLTVFAVIDHAAAARGAGLTLRETRVVIFGAPRAGTAVMEAVPLVALDLPLKVLIWEDGSRSQVTYLAPRGLARRYGLAPPLAARLAGIDGIVSAAIDRASRS